MTARAGGPVTGRRVLVVCTGNLCRSPLAAAQLERLVRVDGATIDVQSAGLHAALDVAVPSALLDLVPNDAERLVSHRPRSLTRSMIADADLVLTGDRSHRAAVVSMLPRATRRTFTLLELARIVEAEGAFDLGGLDAIAALRGVTRRNDPAADDVVDPYGADDRAYRTMVDQVTQATDIIASRIR